MNDELKSWFLQLANSQKQIFLARLSCDLTLHGRWFGTEPISEKQIQGFKGLNELQHQISQHIAHLGSGDARYPDDLLWTILHEKAASYGISKQLSSSLKIAREKTPSP